MIQGNEQKLLVNIDDIPTGIISVDSEWKVTSFNREASGLTGYSMEEAVGMRVKNILAGAMGNSEEGVISILSRGEEYVNSNFKFLDEDGRKVSCQIKAVPKMGPNSTLKGATLYLNKVGETNQADNLFINAIPTVVMGIDRDFNITFMNQAGLDMAGRKKEDVIGKKCHSVFNTEYCNTESCPFHLVARDGKSRTSDASANIAGKKVPIRVTIKPIMDSKGDVIGAVEQIVDISMEVQVTREIVDLVEAGISGNIKKRADQNKFEGNYRKIVEGTNQMLDAYLAPLKMAAIYVDKISKGQIPEKITQEYNGQFNIMKDNLNKCIDAVNNLVEDSRMLTEAASKGQFSKRADVTRHVGDYAQVVEGVNKTLGVVVDRMFWYEQMLDAIPFPLSVTDMNMNITFLNKASEKIVNKPRAEMEGKHCSAWNGRICNTDDCGIKRLQGGNSKTYSDRGGKVTQINCTYLKDAAGKNIGHIEVLQDVSSAMKSAQYNKVEVERLANNLRNIAKGDLTIDSNLAAPDQYTKEAYDNFQTIYASLGELNLAIKNLVTDAGMLVTAAKSEKFETRADASKHNGEFANVVKGVNETMDVVVDKIFWFEQLLDAIPLPISVTDNDMNWTFINKPVEQMLSLKRRDVVGKHCSNWNASICRTKDCGVARLKGGQIQSKFEQMGMNFQVDTAYVKNAKGEPIGHIEVVQDITAVAKNAEYRAAELKRVQKNMQNLAEGKMDIDTNVSVADKYTQEAFEEYSLLTQKLMDVKIAVDALSRDAKLLVDAAIHGQLDVRADASKHKGEYRAIVEGVNVTLDSIVGHLETIPLPIQFMDKDFRIQYINKTGAGLLGSTKQSLVGKKCSDAWNTSKCRTAGCPCDTAMRTNDVFTCENDTRIGEKTLDINCVGAPLRDMHGNVIGSFEFVADQTDIKNIARKAEKVNRYQAEQVNIINDSLGELATGDLTVEIPVLPGDQDTMEARRTFEAVIGAINTFKNSIGELLQQVDSAVEMVSATSQELASSAEEMNASTEQVSSAIQQISKGAQSQASQVEETARIMVGISNAVENVVGITKEASEAARRSKENANQGKVTVKDTVKKMQGIQGVTQEAAAVIGVLGKRSEEIGEIVDVITNISDQTNLLALNAAIEAARAGEQGRGFAVVAEEVKNLAEDSREAAERIAKMIKEVQLETSKAVESMQKGTREAADGMVIVEMAGRAFEEIASATAHTAEEVDRISKLMDDQREGTGRAAKAVGGVASIAEETASASEESAASTEELTASMEDMTARAQSLAEMAENLKAMGSKFKFNSTEVAPAPTKTHVKPTDLRTVLEAKKTTASVGKVAMPSKVKEALSRRGIQT